MNNFIFLFKKKVQLNLVPGKYWNVLNYLKLLNLVSSKILNMISGLIKYYNIMLYLLLS